MEQAFQRDAKDMIALRGLVYICALLLQAVRLREFSRISAYPNSPNMGVLVERVLGVCEGLADCEVLATSKQNATIPDRYLGTTRCGLPTWALVRWIDCHQSHRIATFIWPRWHGCFLPDVFHEQVINLASH